MTQYAVVRTIGRGGFGVVEEVRNARNERFAKKTFSPAPSTPAEARESLKKRFKREVKIQEELGGAEILPVLVSGLNDSPPWFIMPLAELTYDMKIQQEKTSGNITIDPLADILNGL